MNSWQIRVEGIGVWSPQAVNVEALRRLLDGEAPVSPIAKPSASILSPNERRRAPESVLVAMEAASQAVSMSGRAADTLPCVFASAYGDQSTTDYMCRVLARSPTELSPTRFHNAVQNASAGYWTIATRCRAPSSALCGGNATFGAGLLEAAVQACADGRAVLLVCSDTVGAGPLGELTGCKLAFGCALVLSPDTATGARLKLAVTEEAPKHQPLPPICMTWMHDTPSAACLPLLDMLLRVGGDCVLSVSEQMGLHVEWELPT